MIVRRDHEGRQGVEVRLAKIEGQIRGIRGMTAEGRDCVEVVTQIAAARAALRKVADLLVADHVECWLYEAADGNPRHRKQDLDDLLRVFGQYYR